MAGSTDGWLNVVEVATGKDVWAEQQQTGIHAVAFSADGKRLASGHRDGTVRLWEAATGKELATFRGHRDEVRAVAFAPEGGLLASASNDTTVVVWAVVPARP